jgi:hypothetical protein
VGQLLSLAKLQFSKAHEESTKYAGELIQAAIIRIRELSHRLNLDWGNEVSFTELLQLEIKKLQKTVLF